MTPLFVISFLTLVGILLVMHGLAIGKPAIVSYLVIGVIGAGGLVLAIVLSMAGLWYIPTSVLGTLAVLEALFWYLRYRNKKRRGSLPPSVRVIETKWLSIHLIDETGDIVGWTKQGPFGQCALDSLRIESLLALYEILQQSDHQGAALLEMFLDNRHGDRWRYFMASRQGGAEFEESASESSQTQNSAGAYDYGMGARSWYYYQDSGNVDDGSAWSGSTRKGARGGMSRAQAWSTLGLQEGASREEVFKAHRRLIIANHPDHGGVSEWAAQINEARDILLQD